ncbi:hypothetical protein K469DRAFT_752576 [Zopfia rhizophila CBS 207.26]|uniref:Knr4/Smi1-like domain-containing protein n=1 Tax=Zopfia rhizophila CBS 207.26 TaxID=1314779 RepID=A0A6A6DTH2_9PEZI|nr:hypothetical protein K469DRAFT_752576 [Zopfia rhizophila CBS 207.26]
MATSVRGIRLHTTGFALKPLWLLWDESGEWPIGEEKRVMEQIGRKKESESGEEGRDSKEAKVKEESKMITRHDVKAEVENLAKSYATGWFWPGAGNNPLLRREEVEKGPHQKELVLGDAEQLIIEILRAIDEMNPAFRDATTGAVAMDLPDDYKEFLSISNGFESGFSGILFEPPLHRTTELRWFGDDEGYFTDLPLDLPVHPYGVARSHDEITENWPTVGMAIEIGTEDIDNTWLIPPKKIEEVTSKIAGILENNEYGEDLKTSFRIAIRDFAGGGSASMVVYPSFKAYIRHVAESSGNDDSEALRKNKFFGYYFRNTSED